MVSGFPLIKLAALALRLFAAGVLCVRLSSAPRNATGTSTVQIQVQQVRVRSTKAWDVKGDNRAQVKDWKVSEEL